MTDISSGRERARERAVCGDQLVPGERPTPLQRDQGKVNERNREEVEELTEEVEDISEADTTVRNR